MSESHTPGSFAEFQGLIQALPGPDEEARKSAAERQGVLTKPPGSLGRLEEIALWMAAWQGREAPKAEHPRVAVFAGNHGVAARGVSAFPSEVTVQMVANFVAGGAAVNQLSAAADADLKVFELALDQPTADFTQGAAMTEEECCRAMAYGMTAVEDGLDMIALGEMGIANTTSASALCLALFGGEAGDWVGRGTGVDDEKLAHKTAVVAEAVALHQDKLDDPWQILAALGGLELAAITGAVLAARMARVPVLLDGFACTTAAAVLNRISPSLLDHCLVAHRSVEPGHTQLLNRLGKEPLFNFDMRLGEASGAALAISVVKAAVACHNGMATFAEAAVSGPGKE